MSKAKLIFAFIAGAGVGSLVTYKVLKSKYDQVFQDEINSIRDMASQMRNSEQATDEVSQSEDEEKAAYAEIASGYETYTEDDVYGEHPYVITPEECGQLEGYEIIGLTMFNDGILANDFGDEIEDIDGTVGLESLKHFGEYDEDAVYVRNDRLKRDYEIALDPRNFSELDDE